MSLVIDLQITRTDGRLPHIERLVIGRKEPLSNRLNPDNEVHTYGAYIAERQGSGSPTLLKHRYGDGAWVLVAKAMSALGIDLPPSRSDHDHSA